MSDDTALQSVADRRPASSLPILVRAAVFAGAWAPALALVVLFVPRFSSLFGALDDRGELPRSTAWLMWFGQVNERLWYAPCLLLLVLLVAVDMAAAHFLQRSPWGRSVYWAWFALVIVLGLIAVNAVVVVLVLPVYMMSPPV
jgi:hypothetical protein